MGQNLFLMSHPDVSLVNILLSITRVSLVQNKCVFCQLRVHFNIMHDFYEHTTYNLHHQIDEKEKFPTNNLMTGYSINNKQ